MKTEILSAVFLPFLGTIIGSGFVFFLKGEMSRRLQRSLMGFASGVMVAASVWSLIIPAMEETIKLIHAEAPWCKVVVGGAVLTQDYADRIGADKYAKDAMEAVRYADEVNASL